MLIMHKGTDTRHWKLEVLNAQYGYMIIMWRKLDYIVTLDGYSSTLEENILCWNLGLILYSDIGWLFKRFG